MPSEDFPRVGATWRLRAVDSNPVGFVAAVVNDVVTVVSRVGNRATVPLRSFLLTWNLEHRATNGRACSVCLDSGDHFAQPAILAYNRSFQSRAIVCAKHVPWGVENYSPDTPNELGAEIVHPPWSPPCIHDGLLAVENRGVLDREDITVWECAAQHRWVRVDYINRVEDLPEKLTYILQHMRTRFPNMRSQPSIVVGPQVYPVIEQLVVEAVFAGASLRSEPLEWPAVVYFGALRGMESPPLSTIQLGIGDELENIASHQVVRIVSLEKDIAVALVLTVAEDSRPRIDEVQGTIRIRLSAERLQNWKRLARPTAYDVLLADHFG